MKPNQIYGGGGNNATAEQMYGKQGDNRTAAEMYGGNNAPKGDSVYQATRDAMSHAASGFIDYLSTIDLNKLNKPGDPNSYDKRDTSVIEDFINFLAKHQDKLKPFIQTGPNAKRMSDQDQGPDILDNLTIGNLDKAKEFLENNKPKVDPQAILKSKKKK